MTPAKRALTKAFAGAAAIVGTLLVLTAVVVPALALVAGQLQNEYILVGAGTVLALGLLTGVPLLIFAGRRLRYSLVLKMGGGVIAALSLAFLGWMYQLEAVEESKIKLTNGVLLIQGRLDPDLLAAFRKIVATSDLRNVRVRLRSPGGNIYVGMAIGREIHRLNLDVEVDRRCSSSCANYLFTAGRRKYVQSTSHVQFHGGALQPDFVADARRLLAQGTAWTSGLGIPDPESPRLLFGLADDFPFNSAAAIVAEKAFFDEIGVSELTPVYGQYGEYAAWFNDGIHDNFSYLPEDYARLGVTDVIVMDPDAASKFGDALFRATTSVEAINALHEEMSALYDQIRDAMPNPNREIWHDLEPAHEQDPGT